MITFLQLGEYGRLGNQFFQYAALRGLGLKRGYETKIPDHNTRYWHGQNCLLGNFNIKTPFLEEKDLGKIKYLYSEPDYMSFDNNFFDIPDGTNISGFFQSTYYFKDYEKEIKEELAPKKHFLDKAKETLAHIKEENSGHDIVSLHIRRGDNVDNTDPSQVELNNFYGAQGSKRLCTNSTYYKYFSKAKEVFTGKKVKFLVFTGGKRGSDSNTEDIEWCRSSFSGQEFIFSEKRSTIEDFSLIMSCDHNIISHVSSYGWWAAFLNQNKNKTVVAPLSYHPDRTDINSRPGFYPEDWRLV